MYNNIKILAVDDSQGDTQLLKDCYKTYKDITDTVLEGINRHAWLYSRWDNQ